MPDTTPQPDTETEVWTLRGLMPRTELVRTEGTEENDREFTRWQAFNARDNGELVRRDVHVLLKEGLNLGVALNLEPTT